jgi:hypothetical protein
LEVEEDTEPQQPPASQPSSSSLWGPPQHDRRGSNHFSGGARGANLNEAPHVNKDSTPLCVFMLYFTAIIHLLVVETNRYYHLYIDSLDDGRSPRPDVTDSEMFLFLGIIIQMGHDIRDRIKDYWSTAEQFHTPFYSNAMKRDRFLHILRLDNNAETDKLTIMTDSGKFGLSSTH